MRQVKCRNCGTFINRDSAINVQNGKAKIWYCNENCRQQAEEKKNAAKMAKETMRIAKKQKLEEAKAESKRLKEIKDNVYYEICDIFGYTIVNTAFFKEWAYWNKIANNEEILSYIKENKDYVKNAMKNASGTEYAKIRYMSAILKNNLADYKTTERGKRAQLSIIDDAMPKESSFVLFDPVKENKNERKSFAELEDDL